jgi:hypothetical protein
LIVPQGCVWLDSTTLREIGYLEIPRLGGSEMEFDISGAKLAVWNRNYVGGGLIILDLDKSTVWARLPEDIKGAPSMTSGALSGDFKTFALHHGGLVGDGALTFYSLPFGSKIGELSGEKQWTTFAFSASGKHFLAGGGGNVTLFGSSMEGLTTKSPVVVAKAPSSEDSTLSGIKSWMNTKPKSEVSPPAESSQSSEAARQRERKAQAESERETARRVTTAKQSEEDKEVAQPFQTGSGPAICGAYIVNGSKVTIKFQMQSAQGWKTFSLAPKTEGFISDEFGCVIRLMQNGRFQKAKIAAYVQPYFPGNAVDYNYIRQMAATQKNVLTVDREGNVAVGQ